MLLWANAKQAYVAALGLTTFLVAAVGQPQRAFADENGVGAWSPGQAGSFAAAAQVPGWTFTDTFAHASASSTGAVAVAREFTIGAFARNASVNLNANLNTRTDMDVAGLTYVFATPVLGGQLAVGASSGVGRNSTSINGTLTASIGNLSVTRTGSISDERFGAGDLLTAASLRWNSGFNNFAVYFGGNVPTGTYASTGLANLGIGHGAIDGGLAYTFYNEKTGREFSVVSGLTGNFVNPSTNYQSGVDWHVDWAASQALNDHLSVGIAGYYYKQITADTGGLPILGGFESRIAGVGPQASYSFPVGKMLGSLTLKGYRDFDAENRASGWSTSLAFSLSPAAPPAPVGAAKPMYTK